MDKLLRDDVVQARCSASITKLSCSKLVGTGRFILAEHVTDDFRVRNS